MNLMSTCKYDITFFVRYKKYNFDDDFSDVLCSCSELYYEAIKIIIRVFEGITSFQYVRNMICSPECYLLERMKKRVPISVRNAWDRKRRNLVKVNELWSAFRGRNCSLRENKSRNEGAVGKNGNSSVESNQRALTHVHARRKIISKAFPRIRSCS